MYLMNSDIPVLWFDDTEKEIKILNNRLLPLQLTDMLMDTKDCKSISEGMKNYDRLRTFFSDRVLSLSRDNAKQILESINNTQKLTETERMRLSVKCRGVSVNDNFWVKEDTEEIAFNEVNIRNRHLSDIIFQISMKGTPISISHDLMAIDISGKGIFRKTWLRLDNELYLCKSDRTTDKINTKAEIRVSDMLDEAGADHVKYKAFEKDGEFCCICKCFNDDRHSYIDAEYVKAYIENHGGNFIDYIRNNYAEQFANMVVADYCFCNPDEHINNWGFMVNAETNEIEGLSMLFDYNQAMIAFDMHTENIFDELIYDPTGKTVLESASEWFPYSTLDLSKVSDKRVSDRYEKLLLMKDMENSEHDKY